LPAATLLTVVFLVENPALRESVKKAAGFCEWYERKSMPWITCCITDAKNVLTTLFDGISMSYYD
jgi:hypothetical protein